MCETVESKYRSASCFKICVLVICGTSNTKPRVREERDADSSNINYFTTVNLIMGQVYWLSTVLQVLGADHMLTIAILNLMCATDDKETVQSY